MSMNPVTRYIRAFLIALWMTLRGEKPPEPAYPELVVWSREMLQLVQSVYTAAESAGLDKSARQSIVLRLDGRAMNVETILGAFRYHAAHEYPSLLKSAGRFNRNAVQATNINDRYWLSQLAEETALQNASLQAAFARLSDHLGAIS